ncbi:class I SAM-dependent methyltransferase [uncultured Pseudodesulfovibrio sp.]|uniref:class I SAM-dependent methyltransferase n=1 Tax=uncultured Pseudodesulfovibrio sp. TaxID=2035858 RepID=UPI0029C844ED|nr:class I SAM-dependent methyltransferase [uncultured Pseudodesulfovibrio sp.]
MSEFFKRDDCRLCKSKNLKLVVDMGAVPLGDDFVTKEQFDRPQGEYPLEINFCEDCGLLQSTTVIDPDIIYSNYLYETSSSLGLMQHFEDYAAYLMDKINPPQGALTVDIGSNIGALLKGLKAHGMNVLGIDPAKALAEKATKNGLETWAAFFNREMAEKIRDEKGAATIITANNVMANIDDLTDIMEGITTLLADDGVFVFETGYMMDTVQNVVIDNLTHEHLCYFSVLPLQKFFEAHGLELIDIKRIPTKGGSIRGTVQRKGGGRPVTTNVTGLATLERELGFEGMAPFTVFAKLCEQMKSEIRELLTDLKAQGKKVGAYGASIGATSLIYYMGLGDLIDCLYDDNPVKIGMYSPVQHIPVHDSAMIYEHRPDYVLNLAWRYAGPIYRRHQKYIEEGGRFISCLPTVSIFSK